MQMSWVRSLAIWGVFGFFTLPTQVFAVSPFGVDPAPQLTRNEPTTAHRLPTENLPLRPKRHPLAPAVQLALEAYQYAQNQVRDYTCVLVKRERIEGDLKDTQTMYAAVRAEQAQNGHVAQPYSVFLKYMGPPELRGRKVLYIQGQNEGKILVRNGGKRFNYLTVKVDPSSSAAMRESLVPITEIGFASVTKSLIDLIQQDIRRDPNASNTQVKFFRRAKVNDRVCTRISVLHPQADPILEFARADAFIDDELHVPIRIEAYTWARESNEPQPLLFEYTYTNLKLNVGLTDADFSTRMLEAR